MNIIADYEYFKRFKQMRTCQTILNIYKSGKIDTLVDSIKNGESAEMFVEKALNIFNIKPEALDKIGVTPEIIVNTAAEAAPFVIAALEGLLVGAAIGATIGIFAGIILYIIYVMFFSGGADAPGGVLPRWWNFDMNNIEFNKNILTIESGCIMFEDLQIMCETSKILVFLNENPKTIGFVQENFQMLLEYFKSFPFSWLLPLTYTLDKKMSANDILSEILKENSEVIQGHIKNYKILNENPQILPILRANKLITIQKLQANPEIYKAAKDHFMKIQAKNSTAAVKTVETRQEPVKPEPAKVSQKQNITLGAKIALKVITSAFSFPQKKQEQEKIMIQWDE